MAFDRVFAEKQGAFLQSKRLEAGITSQEKAARMLTELTGITFTKSAWGMWESGRRHIDGKLSYPLSKIVKTDPWLLTDGFQHIKNEKNHYTPFLELIKRNIELTDLIQLKMYDRSLEPSVNNGDSLLVLKGESEINEPTLVVMNGKTEGYWIRYIKPERKGGFTLYSLDKDNYPDEHIETLESINMLGKVINITRWL